MDNINDFYPSQRVEAGSTFIILEFGKVTITEIVQVDSVNRGGYFGRIYKAILLDKAQQYGNEIEVYEDNFYPKPKKIPSTRIVRPKHEVFTVDDLKWLLSGLSKDAQVYHWGTFSWVFSYAVRDMERHVRLVRGLDEVAALQEKLKGLLSIGETEPPTA